MKQFMEIYKIDRNKIITLMKRKMENGIYKALFRPVRGESLRTRIYFDKEKIKVWVKDNPEMMHYLTTRLS